MEQYILAIYYCITTMTTVGYGDISPGTTVEMVFGIAIMVLGVLIFTFISGSLSSIIQNVDSSTASLQEKILFLGRLKEAYSIGDSLYNECRDAINYDSKTTMIGLDEFIKSLPKQLS